MHRRKKAEVIEFGYAGDRKVLSELHLMEDIKTVAT